MQTKEKKDVVSRLIDFKSLFSVYILFFICLCCLTCCQRDKASGEKKKTNRFEVSESEIGLICSPSELNDLNFQAGTCQLDILKDSLYIEEVLNASTPEFCITFLNVKKRSWSVCLWLYMKYGKDASHYYKLSKVKWYELYFDKEIEYWNEFLKTENLDEDH